MTLDAKMGYNTYMVADVIFFALRVLLVAALWAFVWQLIEPKTPLMRIMRAALLVLCLFAILSLIRFTGA